MTAQVAADLRAAAEVLRRDGWTQGTYLDGKGCKCLSGALIAATGTDPDSVYGEGYERAMAAAAAVADRVNARAVWLWNDHPNRTAEEVIAALEAAADAAEAAA